MQIFLSKISKLEKFDGFQNSAVSFYEEHLDKNSTIFKRSFRRVKLSKILRNITGTNVPLMVYSRSTLEISSLLSIKRVKAISKETSGNNKRLDYC